MALTPASPSPHLPTTEQIRSALESPDAFVRAAAKRLLYGGGPPAILDLSHERLGHLLQLNDYGLRRVVAEWLEGLDTSVTSVHTLWYDELQRAASRASPRRADGGSRHRSARHGSDEHGRRR